jgi:putative endonuclease
VSAWVYLLRCADGSLYTGWTIDLERRLARHAAGTASAYTRSRRPVELALALPMPDRSAARREEARIKALPRAEKLALVAAPGHPSRSHSSGAAIAAPASSTPAISAKASR